MTMIATSSTNNTTTKKDISVRIDYDSWEKRISDLSKQLDDEEETERKADASALGLNKHAQSAAKAE